MKIPNDPANPSFDNARKVGFWEWLTSSAATRREWRRRRDAAIHTSRFNRFTEGQIATAAEKAGQTPEEIAETMRASREDGMLNRHIRRQRERGPAA